MTDPKPPQKINPQTLAKYKRDLGIDNYTDLIDPMGDDSQAPEGQIPAKEMEVLVNRLTHGKTLAQSVLEAGYECKTMAQATAIGSKIIKKHKDANGELIKALDKRFVNADRVAEILDDATKATTFVRTGKDEFEEVPDHSIRLKAADSVLDIRGGKAPKVTTNVEMTFEQRLLKITMGQEDG
jgi:hypothetical protein